MFWLFLLFVVVPALELYLLIQIGTVIGATNTFILILITGIIGSYMAKTQGLSTWRALNKRFASGQIPGKELADGAIILVAGALLLTPGVLTDIVGFLGLIPVTRSLLRSTVMSIFKRIPTVSVGMRVESTFTNSGEPQRHDDFRADGFPEDEVREDDYHEDVTLSGRAHSTPRYGNEDLN